MTLRLMSAFRQADKSRLLHQLRQPAESLVDYETRVKFGR